MRRLGDILLNEQTRVTINIATLLIVIGFSITATFTFTTWKTSFEIVQKAEIVRLTDEISERKLVDAEMDLKLKETNTILIESNMQLTEMQTDLKWIKSFLMSSELQGVGE